MTAPTMKGIYTDTGIDDPYPLYKRIREIDPVYWDAQMGDAGGWMITGYEAAITVLLATGMSAKRPAWQPSTLPPGTEPAQIRAMHAINQQVVTSDPPDHTRLRKQLNRPFLPRSVEGMRDRVHRAAHALLDAALSDATGELDVMARYGFALPVMSLGRLLGIPVDHQQYLNWMLSLGLLIDDSPVSREYQPKLLAGVNEYLDFFHALVERRSDTRCDDLLQSLADSYTHGGFVDEEELLANLAFLLTAGQVSTAHQIGNTLLHLLRDPELYELVRADPARVADMSAEFMRFDSSIQLTKRRVREPMELGGHELPAGAEVFVWIGAAHRDPVRFPDPDRIDPDRAVGDHIVFGRGIHYCLGARLGQLVHDTAVQAFVERVPKPRLALTDRVERSIMPTFRGPYRLPVAFG